VPGVPSILSLGARGLLVAAPTAAWLLDAASGKQVAVFQFQRTDTLLSAAYSEKLALVVTGHRGHEARAWDAGNGKQVATLTGHTGAVVDVAFSRAGEPALATASTSGAVRIFDPSQVPGRTMLTGLLSGHTLDVLSVGFGSGEEVVTTSVDRTARVWTRDGQTLAILAGHTQRVTDAELAGLTALTWSPDGTARTWAWAPDPRVSRAGGFSSEPATAAIAGAAAVAVARVRNDGELLASARRKTLRVPAIGAVQAVAMSADGSTVATGHERGVALWSSASGAQRRLIEQRQPVSMTALSADGGTVVAGTRTGGLEVWGEQPAPREIATGLGPIAGGKISSDGRYVAAGDTAGAAGVWELSSGRLVARLAGHRKAVTGMAFSADSQFVGAGSYDHEVRVWRVADGSLVHTLPHTAVASGLAFSPDGRWVVTAGPQRAVVWEMRTGNPVVKLAGVAGKGQFLTVGFSPDGRTIHTVESDGDVGSYACVVCGSIDEVRAAAQERLRRLAP
jgi:WD40 repeat protein